MTRSLLSRLSRRMSQPEASDREVLARVAAGDGAAFAALVGRHGRAVLAACRHVLSDPADIDDAFQAAFVVLFRRAGRVRWAADVGGWLYAAAHRIAVRARADRLRRTAREAAARKPDRADAPDPSWREVMAALHEELDRLPDRHRLPLLLCYLDGRSRDEAAALLGWSAGAVKGCLERGRRVLADRLRERGIDLGAGLLGAVAASAAGAGGPTPRLVERTLAAAGGCPPAVAVLVKGMTPMKLLPTVLGLTLAGVVGLAAVAVGLPERPAADRPPADRPEPAVPAKPAAEPVDDDDELREVESVVAGRVVGPDDQPVAGAAVYWVGYAWPAAKPEPRARTAADGSFRFPVRHRAMDYNGKRGVPWAFGFVAVTADGHGFGWLDPRKPTDDAVVRLPLDDQPARGQVVDAAGHGVAGVTVRCRTISRAREGKDLSDWLAAARAKGDPGYLDHLHHNWVETAIDHLLPRATTGPDGGFELRGVGRERLALLMLTGPTVTAREAFVYTRPGGPVAVVPAALPRGGDTPAETHYGLPATIPTTPAPPVTGTVTTSDTGRPLPGVLVRSLVPARGLTTGFLLQTRTGPDGAYRLDGLSPTAPAEVEFAHPDLPYHTAVVEVPAGRDGTEGPVDVVMRRGVPVTVKAREKGTGKPVRVEWRYTVFDDNPNLDRRRLPPVEHLLGAFASDFRVVAYPGSGMLAVKAAGGGPYRRGVGDDRFPKYRRGEQILDGWPISNTVIRQWNTLVPLHPTGDEPVELTVELDPGLTQEVFVVGPGGQPPAGAVAWGLWPGPWPGWRDTPPGARRVKVRGLEPGEERRVVVAHEGKTLIGTAVVHGGHRGTPAVVLKPWATVKGRVVDELFQPAKGASVALTGHPILALPGGQRIWIEADGRFTIPGLVPGLEYELSAWPPDPADGRPRRSVPTVTRLTAPPPGETKDLGDVTVPRP